MMFTPILIVLALAPDPPRESCDLACSARVHAATADDPATPIDRRGFHAVAAARAYLLLFRETGERAHLCSAKRWAARGGKKLPPSIAARLVKTRADIQAEMAGADVACGEQRPGTPPQEPAVAAASPVSRSIGTTPTGVPVPSPIAKPSPVHSDLPVRPAAVAPRRARPARVGLGLLAAGGVGVVVTAGLASSAGLAKVQLDHAVEAGRALTSKSQAQGFADPSMVAEFREREADAGRWHRTLIGTSIAAGAAGVAAIVLLATGASRRLQRPRSRVAIQPSVLGLLIDARF